jgi:hypothetical protein
MQAPMDIAQFNALLHSKKDNSELISMLRELMSADVEILAKPVILWTAW